MQDIIACLLSLLVLKEVKSDCNYSQNLETGQTYYVYNPNYPDLYKGENHCTWQTFSSYSIKLNCSIDMPAASNGCSEDKLAIKFTDETNEQYCGNGKFVLEGKNAVISLDSPHSSQGGKFLCEVRAEDVDEYNCRCGWKKVVRKARTLGGAETIVKGNPLMSSLVDSVQRGSEILKATRIVGGSTTDVNEYPMMAGLVDLTQRELYCGATIISQRYVITAAHCLENRNGEKIGVVVGEHDTTTGSDTNATKLFRINQCLIHPEYEDFHNDVAICMIHGTITYSAEVGPACLPFQHRQDSFAGNIVTILGWGLIEFGGAKSKDLQEAKVNVIDLAKCRQSYSNVTNSNICTYTPGKDSCQMDSGGPLLWEDPTTHNVVLVGIISSGIGCASDKPSVGMRVAAFIDWIVSVTPGVQYCKVE